MKVHLQKGLLAAPEEGVGVKRFLNSAMLMVHLNRFSWSTRTNIQLAISIPIISGKRNSLNRDIAKSNMFYP